MVSFGDTKPRKRCGSVRSGDLSGSGYAERTHVHRTTVLRVHASNDTRVVAKILKHFQVFTFFDTNTPRVSRMLSIRVIPQEQ